MVRLTLEPITAGAGGPRLFNVISFAYTKDNQQLVLVCRDGKMCIELVGAWRMHVAETRVLAHSLAEAERVHDGSPLVLVSH